VMTSRDFRQLRNAIVLGTGLVVAGPHLINEIHKALTTPPDSRMPLSSPAPTDSLEARTEDLVINDPLNEPPYAASGIVESEKSPVLAQEMKKKIVLDAGHGMGNRTSKVYDPGAIMGDIQEAVLNLKYAREVEELLKEKGYDVIQTRTDNQTEVPLGKRASIANDAGADLFVSVHCNASTSKNSRGVIVYHYPGSERGESAAKSVRKNLVKILDEEVEDFDSSLGSIMEEAFYVLKHTKMPAILVETGFLTNETDRNYLLNNPRTIARGIADGIDSYFKGEN